MAHFLIILVVLQLLSFSNSYGSFGSLIHEKAKVIEQENKHGNANPQIKTATYFENEDCSNPGQYIQEVLAIANRSRNISDVIKALTFPACTLIGANESFSAQTSLNNRDPRFYIKTRCRILTFTLFGNSLELGITGQIAEKELPSLVKTGTSKINRATDGEILVDIRPFPRDGGVFGATLPKIPVVNTWNPKYGLEKGVPHDVKSCSSCHNDIIQTKGSLGLKRIKVGDQELDAIVSPYYALRKGGAEGQLYCIPSDLKLLYKCQCEAQVKPVKECESFQNLNDEPHWRERTESDKESARTEGCERLRLVMNINSCQNTQYDPRSNKQDCFLKP